jgi:3',5'-cyclic AMP phosphodiesterase CpdA
MNRASSVRFQGSVISRRRFIQILVGLATVSAAGCRKPVETGDKVSVGMLADVHYADRERVNQRYYRESIAKVRECIRDFNSVEPDFIVQLGDFVDKGESVEEELGYLERIEREYAKFKGERHYVLGNHDVATFSKEQFISNCGARENYYSFDKGNFHFIVLDACYNEDESDYKAGNFDWTETYIPIAQQRWLEADLQETSKKTVVFVHQRLDDEHGAHGVKNSPQVRKILERSGKLLAVFQGHDHSGAYSNINNIHYYTLPALVRGPGLGNNAYAVVQIWLDGSVKIKGFGKIKDRELSLERN